MKKSINVWSFPPEWTLDRKLALAREAGFAGFEIDLSDDGPLNLKTTPAEVAALRRKIESAGLTVSGVATGLYWGSNPVSADPAIRSRAEAILRAEITAAAALGVDAVLVVPGAVGVDFIPGAEVIPYDVAYGRAQQFIQNALPLATERKVQLCIENVWNKFLLSPREMRAFIEGFGSAQVGAYFDVGNVLATGYPEHWIATLGGLIRRVHFKDYRRAVGTGRGFCDLLSGDVNWPEVMTTLRQAGYDGWVAAEMIPPMPFYQHCPEVLIHNTSRAMDAIFALRS